MYPAIPNSPTSQLTAQIDDIATTIPVADATKFPDAPNLATIGIDREDAETILYTSKDGNSLTGVTRGYGGTTAKGWNDNTLVARVHTSEDHKNFIERLMGLTLERSGKDEEGIFVTLEWKRPDATLFKKSVLSGGASPSYTTRTVTYYESDGTTTKHEDVYTLSYDLDGDLSSEVLN